MKKYGKLLFILLTCSIFNPGCSSHLDSTGNIKSDDDIVKKLQQVLEITTKTPDTLHIIVIPPNSCSSCQDGVGDKIASLDHVIIYLPENRDGNFPKNATIKHYNAIKLTQSSLYKLYSVYYRVSMGKLLEYEPLVK